MKTDTNIQVERIKHLRNKNKLSFIVGAGFSKNMSRKFVDWKGLLTPIVKELYKLEDKDDIAYKIEEVGYLEIAQEYVRRKGYHEAIDIHIEKNTPIISHRKNPQNIEEEEYVVRMGREEVGVADPTCHKLLFAIGAQQIFTFNYDNCLDIVGKTKDYEIILAKIRNARKSLDLIHRLQEYLEKFLSDLEEPSTTLSDAKIVEDKIEDLSSKFSQFISLIREAFPMLNFLHEEIKSIYECRRIAKEEEEKLNNEISQLEKQGNSCYQLITSSGMISLTDGKKSIFKLHGTIRTEDETGYGFDGDSRCHYIITSDDYKDYPQKHEPFVNYMKIALLTGSFCILGFSCDDPNFLSWIGWVKDVVDKNPDIRTELSNSKTARFFYINSGNAPLSDEKRLLLKNHHIECVDLFNVYKEFCHKGKIISFLKDLIPSTSYLPQISTSWYRINQQLYKKINDSKELNLLPVKKDVGLIHGARKFNRIPIQLCTEHFYRDNILSLYYQKLLTTRSSFGMRHEAMLLFSALREELLLPAHIINEEKHPQFIKEMSNSLSEDFYYLINKERILTNKDLVETDFTVPIFFRILQSLYKFDFKGAKSIIDSWDSTEEPTFDRVRHLMVKSLFIYDIECQIFPLSNQDLYESDQDYLNSLELLSSVGRTFYFIDGKMYNTIDVNEEMHQMKLKCPYLKSANDIIDKLIDKLRGYPKPTPFGNQSRTFSFGGRNQKYVEAFKVLSIFFEICKPLHINNNILWSVEKWHIVCDYLYKDFPYPCLFYSLQYDDSKLTKSVSQKILYCDSLKAELPNMVRCLFRALQQEECPSYYRRPIMQSLEILLKGVGEEVWFKDFIVFFESVHPYGETRKKRFENPDFYQDDYSDLIKFGLSHTADKEFKLRVISEILSCRDQIDNWENELIINAKKGLEKKDYLASLYYERILQGLYWLCENSRTAAQVYVLLNMSEFIDNGTIQKCLEMLPDSLIQEGDTLMKAIPYYVPSSSGVITRIKELVLKSDDLWRNGIREDGIGIGGTFIEISEISQKISFSSYELNIIWEKMITSLSQVTRVCEDRSGNDSDFIVHHFLPLLTEMKLFMENTLLHDIPRDEKLKVYEKIEQLRISISSASSHSILELLAQDVTGDAIAMLVEIAPEKRFPLYQNEYMMIAQKLLMKQSRYLNSCMRHFSWVVSSYAGLIPQSSFKTLIESILIVYIPYFNGDKNWDLINAKKEDFEDGLVMLYSTFKAWGGYNKFWDDYKPRFIKEH